jgi:hypothetical protein
MKVLVDIKAMFTGENGLISGKIPEIGIDIDVIVYSLYT